MLPFLLLLSQYGRKTKEKLENQLQALLDFQQQLKDFLSCKEL